MTSSSSSFCAVHAFLVAAVVADYQRFVLFCLFVHVCVQRFREFRQQLLILFGRLPFPTLTTSSASFVLFLSSVAAYPIQVLVFVFKEDDLLVSSLNSARLSCSLEAVYDSWSE
jgi:hypothetical protein